MGSVDATQAVCTIHTIVHSEAKNYIKCTGHFLSKIFVEVMGTWEVHQHGFLQGAVSSCPSPGSLGCSACRIDLSWFKNSYYGTYTSKTAGMSMVTSATSMAIPRKSKPAVATETTPRDCGGWKIMTVDILKAFWARMDLNVLKHFHTIQLQMAYRRAARKGVWRRWLMWAWKKIQIGFFWTMPQITMDVSLA